MMHFSLDKEEAALRRRALFRLLRRFDFDAPEFRGEAISAPVHERVSAPEYEQPCHSTLSDKALPRRQAQADATAIAGPPRKWAGSSRGFSARP
jgi:hypothetical protein